MKEKVVIFATILIFAFFTGYLFLHGERVINGQDANAFTTVAFQDNATVFNLQSKDPAPLIVTISTKKEKKERYNISFFVNEELIDSSEVSLLDNNRKIKPSEKLLAKVGELSSGQTFEYKVLVSYGNEQKDYVKKTITVK